MAHPSFSVQSSRLFLSSLQRTLLAYAVITSPVTHTSNTVTTYKLSGNHCFSFYCFFSMVFLEESIHGSYTVVGVQECKFLKKRFQCLKQKLAQLERFHLGDIVISVKFPGNMTIQKYNIIEANKSWCTIPHKCKW